MQVERRQNPYPYTWEIPAGILTTWAMLLVLGAHLGRGIATWFAGDGWHWPEPAALLSSLPAIVSKAATSAAPAHLLGWVVAIEALLLLAGMVAVVWSLRRWGPGRLRGMATAAEAEASLGLSRLRRVRTVIRPDLYAQPHTTGKEATP